MTQTDYDTFLRAKVKFAETFGFAIADSQISPKLKPHQRAIVKWLVNGGRRACFELNPAYFIDGVSYCRAAAEELSMPTLFDVSNLDAPVCDAAAS